MADPLQTDFIIDRQVVFEDHFAFFDEDWTGSVFKIQVRLVRDTTTTPLLDWTSPDGVDLEYGGTDTVANHVAAGRLLGSGEDNIYEDINDATGALYVGSDNLTLSVIGVALYAGGFPVPGQSGSSGETGDDLTTYYDIIREPSSGDRTLVMRGKAIVRAGVTIP